MKKKDVFAVLICESSDGWDNEMKGINSSNGTLGLVCLHILVTVIIYSNWYAEEKLVTSHLKRIL